MPVDAKKANALSIGGMPFMPVDYAGAIGLFTQWIAARSARQVCIVNVHTLISARRDPELAKIMRDAALNTMDGQPLRWYANLIHRAALKERVCGPELMLRCLDEGRGKDWTHYLLGGREEVLEVLRERLRERYPGLQIVGAESPPFRPLTAKEDRELTDRINGSGADFLWVGLGAPKQELWIANHLPHLEVPVNVGVGAAFDFHAGSIARAPEWMQRHGLEWTFRLIKDPRLWRRYLSTNPPFLWLLLRDLFRYRIFGRVFR
jgi:N-acetylglucosaminyldiphosphoundecaprenol N-acetyl-beta-D-mannosaminyltransferase